MSSMVEKHNAEWQGHEAVTKHHRDSIRESIHIAVEDANFYKHHGLDHLALLRALYMNFKKKRIAQESGSLNLG